MADALSHYVDKYWNELPGVLAHLCRKATGDSNVWWMDYFKVRYATPPLDQALVIGCGNGWVDRDLIDRGIAAHIDAFDVSPSYLEEAKELRKDRPISYFKSDFRSFSPRKSYDLIVNVAALHHAQYLYRITRVLSTCLTPEGLFVNWEYVGPSRNQYSDRHAAAMEEANAGLPERFRTSHPLRPALRHLLAWEPTEAVHSAELFRAIGHYFDFVERKDLGGGIGYQILWNNIEEFARQDEEANKALAYLLALDDRLTLEGVVPVMHSFFVCRRRMVRESLTAKMDRLLREPLRERFAQFNNGKYPSEMGKRSR